MPELRQNPASKEWVIIATERARRPEDFKSAPEPEILTDSKKHCPFCPGNEALSPPEIYAFRSYDSLPNTPGWWVRVIPNKYPALVRDGRVERVKLDDFFNYLEGLGTHEVIVETPEHDQTIATMPQKQAEELFLAYRERYRTLAANQDFEQVILFKNHGISAGTSLKHPHSQIIAMPITPIHIRYRVEAAMHYFDDNGRCVYCDMIKKERQAGVRSVLETDNFYCFNPFASRLPFETWVLPKKHNSSFEEITPEEAKELSYAMRVMLAKIYRALKNPDYNFVLRSSPCREKNLEYYHWHFQILPRVSAVAGFELGSGVYINTVIPEQAAKFLRETPLDEKAA